MSYADAYDALGHLGAVTRYDDGSPFNEDGDTSTSTSLYDYYCVMLDDAGHVTSSYVQFDEGSSPWF